MPEYGSRVLVTGATGFVGANVVARLASHGWSVVASDPTLPPEPIEALWAPHREGIECVSGDVRNRTAIEEIIAGRDVKHVVHGATITPDARREAEDPETIMEIGVLGTAAILRASSGLDVERFVYLSSAAIYKPVPDDEAVLDETAELNDSGLYPLTKVAGEWLVRHMRATAGIDAVSARLAACYGPLERDTGARTGMSPVWQMVRLAMKGESILVYTPNHVQDFTHVQDIAGGVVALLEAPSLRYEAYNVAGGAGYSYQTLAEHVYREIPRATISSPGPSGGEHSISAAPGLRRGRLSVDRLRTETGFEPEHNLPSGLRQYLGWLEHQPF